MLCHPWLGALEGVDAAVWAAERCGCGQVGRWETSGDVNPPKLEVHCWRPFIYSVLFSEKWDVYVYVHIQFRITYIYIIVYFLLIIFVLLVLRSLC